ncbi:hypothetical protein FSARC_10425 [Fusarium sarcochroum]|uniref:Protein kinase domain-containing protein n=1 Tax=Fusarium sarcochroum TaxID=1208366 RepID=A0A8H4TMH0_9HYPO|nr:hypothetical protein FSARC_10425 [Fusarium sarcochroum]
MPTLKPLPDCEGPKLECFTDDLTTHDFKVLAYLGSGCHSEVVKAEIDGNIYVIKLFFDTFVHEPNYEMCYLDEGYIIDADEIKPLVPSEKMPQYAIDTLRMHATSFNNECRAYGRLKELGREHLAIKAHGYLCVYLKGKILDQFNAAVREAFPDRSYDMQSLLYHDDPDVPVMAIVKDWVQDHRLPNTSKLPRETVERQMSHLPRMLRNIRQLHKCGIVVRDLKDVQYYDGQLGDLSHAWTIPHILGPESGLRPRWTFTSMAAWDLSCFQDILDDWNEMAQKQEPPLKTHNLIACRNSEAHGRLRPRPETYGPFLPLLNYDYGEPCFMKYYPPYDPADFNWRAAQNKTKKAPAGGVTKKRKTGRRSQTRSKKAKKSGKKSGQPE